MLGKRLGWAVYRSMYSMLHKHSLSVYTHTIDKIMDFEGQNIEAVCLLAVG